MYPRFRFSPLLLISFCVFVTSIAGHAAEDTLVLPDFPDVAYGPYESNTLDFWKADAAAPTPLLVHIHGGGFTEGDKRGFTRHNNDEIKRALAAGVSVASINYRFVKDAPLWDILHDSARAIQFMRFKAEEWNIDKKRVACFGGSAGAGTSLWLATHDDLADPDNPDPVLRESTRLVAVGGIEPQASYDFTTWPKILDIPEMTWYVSSLYVCPVFYHTRLWRIYMEEGRKMRADLDMLAHLDATDPPVYLRANQPNAVISTKTLFKMLYHWAWPKLTGKRLPRDPTLNFDLLHHPAHAFAIEQACKQFNIPCVLVTKETPKEKRVSVFDFLLDNLLKN